MSACECVRMETDSGVVYRNKQQVSSPMCSVQSLNSVSPLSYNGYIHVCHVRTVHDLVTYVVYMYTCRLNGMECPVETLHALYMYIYMSVCD